MPPVELSRIRRMLREEEFTGTFICEAPMADTSARSLAVVTKELRGWKKDDPFTMVIMADENLWDLESVKEIAELEAADMVNIKIQKSGGMLEAMRMGRYLQGKRSRYRRLHRRARHDRSLCPCESTPRHRDAESHLRHRLPAAE